MTLCAPERFQPDIQYVAMLPCEVLKSKNFTKILC